GKPLITNTVVASENGLLADVIGASLMGLAPEVSPLATHALAEIGLPPACAVYGDLTPYKSWHNPSRPLRKASQFLASDGQIRRTLSAASVGVHYSDTAVADPVLTRLSTVLMRLVRTSDENPIAAAALWWLLSSAGAIDAMTRSWRILFAKDAVCHRQTSLGL